MEKCLVPPAITVMAATSRLLDLHQSRRGEGAYAPTVPDGAGRNIGIALSVLDILRNIGVSRGFGFVTVEEVQQELDARVAGIEPVELTFVLESIAQEREIHYAVPNTTQGFDHGSTRQTTNLIFFADSRAQVKMTESGRLFLRICDEEQAWLYNDSDALKLITALNQGKFYDIPTLCSKIYLNLTSKSAMLTDLIERPTRQEQCDILIADGKGISDSLTNAKETVQQAMKLAFDQRTADDFEKWQAKEGAEFCLGNIQSELEVLLKLIESVSRRFIEFLSIAQEQRDVDITNFRFLEIADNLVKTCNTQSVDKLEKLMSDILFPDFTVTWFHPEALPGLVDIYDLMDNLDGKPNKTKAFDMNREVSGPVRRFHAFVERHKEKIHALLQVAPVRFSEFLATSDFDLLPGETPLDFIGVYTTPEILDLEDGRKVVVGFTGDALKQDLDGTTIIASDPLIFLDEERL